MDETLQALETRVRELEKHFAVLESSAKSVDRRLTAIENNTTWMLRLIIGGFIGAGVAFVVSGGLVVG